MKKRIGFITEPATFKTGYGRWAKAIIPNLFLTEKYEIFQLVQNFSEGHPELFRVPWVCSGVFRNFDNSRFHNDPNYQKFVAYGNTTVEEFVVKNKLDLVFHINDIWSSSEETYLKANWYKFIGNNFVNYTTLDSLPILPLAKKWAKNCYNFWVWSDFAEKAMKSEFPNVKTLNAAVETSKFFPISHSEKILLRERFNISNDETIILYLGKNQLRKMFWANMEALAKYKKRYNNKIRLLFHCCFAEKQTGWDIDAIRQELELKQDDILCTYFCNNCKNWKIAPYIGDGLNCPMCGAQKTYSTPNITSSIDEEDLNLIYNIADAASSIFTSGGAEYFNIESLLAGLILASTPYSCGEIYTRQSFVYPIKGLFTREHNTGFKKFVPQIESIISFFKYVSLLSPSVSKEIREKGRKWALETFDSNIITKEIENFIDSVPYINWDNYKPEEKRRNPNALNPQIEDDKLWVEELYKTILCDSPDEKGVNDWLFALKAGHSKEDIYKFFITEASKNTKQQTIDDYLDKNDKKRLLIVLKQSIGDNLLVTSLIKNIQKAYPEHSIYIGTEPKYFSIWEHLHVKMIPYVDQMEQELVMTGTGNHKGWFDIYINLGIFTQRQLNYLTNNHITLLHEIN